MSMSAMGWVLFGFAIWAAVIFLKALQNRLAPELNNEGCMGGGEHFAGGDDPIKAKPERDSEMEELRRRVEVLEAIVTDRKFQWESELNRPANGR